MQLRKGFTIVELLVVIAIIGIVAMIASFAWQRYVKNTNLRTAARGLASDMANAKQRSVSEGLCYRMTITTGTPGNYTIEKGDCACCSSCSPPCSLTPTFTVMDTKIPTASGAGLNISSTTYVGNIIYFQPRGTTSLGTVILNNSRVSSATITSNLTGKTYVTFDMH